MRLGIVLLPTDPWPETVERAQRIEALGYDHLWVYDHLSWRRYHDEPWHSTYPWLAGIAALTTTIRLGTMVANPNVRHPLMLAKDAMTIDHLSAGRLILGIGAGGTGFDATAIGQKPLTPGERLSRLEEFVPVVDGLLRGEIHDFDGDWYRLRDVRVLPGCIQQPRVPLAIAAGARRGLGLAAALGDAWVTFGDSAGGDSSAGGTEAAVRAQVEMLEAQCAEVGRDPASIDRIFLVGNSDDRPLQSVAAFEEFAGRYGEIGITDLVFHDPRPDDPFWNDPTEMIDLIAPGRSA